MRGRGGVVMPRRLVAVVLMLPENEKKPAPKAHHINEIWTKRGGDGKMSGSGPSGWKLRPAKRLARSLAERAHGKH